MALYLFFSTIAWYRGLGSVTPFNKHITGIRTCIQILGHSAFLFVILD